ncbi:MAG: hypothetical protein A2664_00670 [Candidatus Taylorbacteria bacterium RIFCSPHIGHO2_01_FULL_46_22b]|uniref:DUF268 domain-containing protein n=1 Tax=Candidatus Taylorbacteria bacterium RIFCSPHIGHO2_01_FULL_46_22b TaxID=1802301 RepID=A0A1G2M3Q8_9BACT|nr:MAG: hypothetical protein A2664_00670 [Candidatus Taylorbacteria bacterium RIFCSPHIGHO2_01_FULL_46_22b]
MIGKYIKFAGFLRDWRRFKSFKSDRFPMDWNNKKPCLYDKTKETGFDRHYVYHPAWAARVLKETNPKKHIDIASTLHFSSIISAFLPIEFYDYRPANLVLPNLSSRAADLMALPFKDKSVDSLSCMHTIEHIGLGRYGDPIDPDGDLKSIKELQRVLAVKGNLLFVVPIGNTPKIIFNAHRIYSYKQIIGYFPELTLKEFSLIPEHAERGGLIRNADPRITEKERYACGCFWFERN